MQFPELYPIENTKKSTSYWTARCLAYSVLCIAVLFLVLYVVLVFLRIRYPFELEWMEGGSVDHVRRILSGQKLYVSPSIEFVPYIYTPLYFYLSAVIAKVSGIGLVPLRLLSFASSVGSFFVVFLIVKRETKNDYSAVLSSCLLAATFQLTGGWFDIARVDSLFLFFLLSAIYAVRFGGSRRSCVISGLLISLSFFTKQTALFPALFIIAYAIVANRRRSAFFIGTTFAIVGGSTWILNHIHNGWYNYYVFELPSQHEIVTNQIISFWSKDLLSAMPFACAMSAFYLCSQLLHSRKKKNYFYFMMAVGMLGGAWFSRIHSLGYRNVLLPAYAIIAILFGLATHRAFEVFQAKSKGRSRSIAIPVYILCLAQFIFLAYNPRSLFPTKNDLEAGRRFIGTISRIDGDVLMPHHGFLPVLAGKNGCAHWAAVNDVLRSVKKETRVKLKTEIKQAIEEKRYDAIILDSFWFLEDMKKHYRIESSAFDDRTVFWPVTGRRTRPEIICVPRDD